MAFAQQATTVIEPDLKYGRPSKEELALTAYVPDTTATAVYLFHKGKSGFTYDDGFRLFTEHWVRIKILKPQGVLVIGDCYQPLLTRWIMNFYMKFSNDGDVKIYSKKEFVSMLSEHFTKIHWVKANAVSCIVAAIKD